MMHRLIKWVTRLGAALVLIVAGLLSPIAYVEIACSSDVGSDDYDAILPAQYHRPESRTLLTYPEWHIVHAYDDYARVISKNDFSKQPLLHVTGDHLAQLYLRGGLTEAAIQVAREDLAARPQQLQQQLQLH